ncbi:MAG: hypothetical protein JSV32_06135 [Dehalococcoidia bacterium]|nr:MAG: hypothetical protein JSV32_06135 [Dehalococcoidia bacterium]
MARCHNCGRETLRTEDWACQWCGYPLPFGPFKKIDKTYRQLKKERLGEPAVEPEGIQEPETEIKSEEVVAPKQDLETIKRIKLEPEPEFKKETVIQQIEPELVEEVKAEKAESAVEPAEENKVEETQAAENRPEVELEPEEVIKPEPEMAKEPEIEEVQGVETIPETEVEQEEAKAKPEAAKEPKLEDILAEESVMEQTLETELKPEPPDMEITVDDILKEYEKDDVAADEMFMNKILRVTGKVSLIDIKDKLDIHYIRITGSSVDPWQNLQCIFDKKYASSLGDLEKGQSVTVQGRYSGSVIAIRMVDCVLVN